MHVDPTQGTVGELMTWDPILVSADAPLSEVAELLDRFDISGVPIVDWYGHVLGVVSQTDLLRVRATEDLWARWPGLAARHLMSRPALTASSGTPIEEAVARMRPTTSIALSSWRTTARLRSASSRPATSSGRWPGGWTGDRSIGTAI
jgi:CBS domain-containing protein